MRIARIGLLIVLLSGVSVGATDFLTEGVDNARTGWVRDEKIFTTANVGEHEAAVEGEAREHAARDAQPVRAAHRREGDHARRGHGRSASSPASPTTCSASTSRPAGRSGTRTSTAGRIRRRRHNDTLCPGRPDRGADDGAGRRPGKYTGLRRLVGRTAAADQRRPTARTSRRRRSSCRAAASRTR